MNRRCEKTGYKKITAIDQGNQGEKFLESRFLHQLVTLYLRKIIDTKSTPEVTVAGDVGSDKFISQWRKMFLRFHKGLKHFSPCFCQVFRLHCLKYQGRSKPQFIIIIDIFKKYKGIIQEGR